MGCCFDGNIFIWDISDFMNIKEVSSIETGFWYVRHGSFTKNALAFVSEIGMHENMLIICDIDENKNISVWK